MQVRLTAKSSYSVASLIDLCKKTSIPDAEVIYGREKLIMVIFSDKFMIWRIFLQKRFKTCADERVKIIIIIIRVFSRKVAKGGAKSRFWVFRGGNALMCEVHFLGGLGACPPENF